MVAFITHKTNTKDTIRRSIFATRRYIDFSQLSLNVCSKIFDPLFAPILPYGSEVGGGGGAYDKIDNFKCEKDIIKKAHIYFCKLTNSVQT